MEQENENQPAPLETENQSRPQETDSIPPDQRRRRPRRRYPRRRYYDRGGRNDNFGSSYQDNSRDYAPSPADGGDPAATEDQPATAETENGEQIQAEPEFGEGII